MSRARLGLFVFCRKSLFENCFELTPSFKILLKRPIKLQLNLNEGYPTQRRVDDLGIPQTIEDLKAMGELVYRMQMNRNIL